ncbi:MAG: InlB B-repeat-containing protein [Lachnospiraceae bacterium]|nr:InlB B-repeat-containing protein [Lachnospiraceae bacterium]
MKQSFKKLLALLLAAVMIIGLLPASAFAKEKGEEESRAVETEKPATGYIPGEVHGASAVSNAYKNGDMETYYCLTGTVPMRDELPATYDSRNYGLVTSMKDQNPYGSCWAHAAMASIESYMIKYGIPVGTGAAATTDLNLSETQHCFFHYTYAYDAEGMLTGDKSTPDDTCMDQGGNGEMSAYTLMRWTGAADESSAALQYSRAGAVNNSGLDSEYAYEYNVTHVQNSVWIPGTSVDAVKRAIMEYGAGNISYYEDYDYNSYICTIDTSSQSSYNHKWANHAITVVGWDDTIATNKFSPNRPSSPGAWICKNSWGTGYFDSGYCYISYEDTTMNEGYIYFYDAAPIDNYDHNYQYDGTCNAVCYGKGWSNSTGYYLGFANNTKVANIFTANGCETLEAVAYCNWDEANTCTVEIYKNPDDRNPESGELVSTASASLTFAGYYTIPLDTPVVLAPGDTFSVVINQDVAVADESGIYVHTPYDASFSNSSIVDWCTWTHADHGDTSFYKEPGGAWTDCADRGDFRIKAYTNDVQFSVTAVSSNEAWGTVSVNGSVITASPAEGYYVSGYEVLEGEATATIDQNIIRVAPLSDCTILIIFAPKPTYTVNFVAMGQAAGSQTAQIYDVITLPSGLTAPEGWIFVGWTSAELPEETAEKPAFYESGAAYTVTGNATLYALYTRQEGSGAVSYRLVESELADWTGSYVITYGKDSSLYMMKGVSVNSNGVDIENSNNAVSLASSGASLTDKLLSGVADNYVFAMESRYGYYSMQNAATGTYLGVTSNSYLGGYQSYVSGSCDWTPGLGDYVTSMQSAVGGNYPYVGFTSSGHYFWTTRYLMYSLTPIHFWKEETDVTTYYHTNPAGEVHTHTMEHVDPVDASCEVDGNIEYWHCTGCGKYFSDAAGQNEIALEDTVIPATGHAWGAPAWTWTETADGFAAEASFVCANDASHTVTLPADVACTEDADGNLVYTAVVTGPDGETYRDVKTVELYLVEFVNDDGIVLQSRKYRLGELPVYEGETPVKEAPYHQYTFTGWDPEITEVTGPATYTAQYDDLLFVQISGMTLSLEGKIGINFFFKAPENAASARLIFHGETETALDFDLIRDKEHGYTASSETFRLSYSNIAMKEMTCPVTLTVYDEAGEQMNLMRSSGPVEGNALDFCVADWANLIIAQNSSDKSVGLAKALLHFGGTAQNYFAFNLENFANPDGYLNGEAAAVEMDPALTRIVPEDAKKTVGYDSFSLNLEGDTEIRIYFTKQVTAKDEKGNAYQVIKSGRKWYVSIPGIASVDLDKMFTVKAAYGGNTRTLQFSALSYANAVFGSSDENKAALARALYLYNEAAEIYFK